MTPKATIDAARRLWAAVDRPNVMIKIPATGPDASRAISAVVAAGINVNVTLIFSVETYEAAALAYLEGLEARSAAGEPIERIGSVASVFVSRLDSAVDALLQERIDAGRPQLRGSSEKPASPTSSSSTSATSASSKASASRRCERRARWSSARCGPAPARKIPPTPNFSTLRDSSERTPSTRCRGRRSTCLMARGHGTARQHRRAISTPRAMF